MINQIIKFIVDNKFTLIIPIIFATALLILDTYANRNKLSTIGFLLFLLSLSGFVFIIIVDIKLFNIELVVYIAVLCLITFFYNSIAYAQATYKYNMLANLLIALPSNIESQVYIYLDNKSRFMMFTDQFYDLFHNFNFDKKNWSKYFDHAVIENKNYTYKDFKSIFQSIEEKTYKIQFVFSNDYIVPVQLIKKKVINNGKLLGYVLINQKLTLTEVYKENVNNEFRKRQHIYFDLLGKPIAYYDFEKKRYILNSMMCRLLNIEENEINRTAFEQLIYEEDEKIYLSRKIHPDCINKNYYRLKTINGVEWFEDNVIEFENKQYAVLYRTDFSSVKIDLYNYVNLIDDLKSLKDFKFILIMISIKDIPEISEKIGKDGCEILISQYFRNIKKYIGETKKIYKVGQIEYAIVIPELNKFEFFIRDLENNHSDLLSVDLYFNEIKFSLKNAVGLVNSQDVVVQTAESIVKAGFDALNLATDEKYMKRYSLYQSSKHVDNSNDFGIDLSDEYLEKLLK